MEDEQLSILELLLEPENLQWVYKSGLSIFGFMMYIYLERIKNYERFNLDYSLRGYYIKLIAIVQSLIVTYIVTIMCLLHLQAITITFILSIVGHFIALGNTNGGYLIKCLLNSIKNIVEILLQRIKIAPEDPLELINKHVKEQKVKNHPVDERVRAKITDIENSLIQNVMIQTIMTGLDKVLQFNIGTKLDQEMLRKLLRTNKTSKVLLYKEYEEDYQISQRMRIDFIGFVTFKELLKLTILNSNKQMSLFDLMEQRKLNLQIPLRIDTSHSVFDVYHLMKDQCYTIALVNEYSNQLGFVTLQSIMDSLLNQYIPSKTQIGENSSRKNEDEDDSDSSGNSLQLRQSQYLMLYDSELDTSLIQKEQTQMNQQRYKSEYAQQKSKKRIEVINNNNNNGQYINLEMSSYIRN